MKADQGRPLRGQPGDLAPAQALWVEGEGGASFKGKKGVQHALGGRQVFETHVLQASSHVRMGLTNGLHLTVATAAAMGKVAPSPPGDRQAGVGRTGGQEMAAVATGIEAKVAPAAGHLPTGNGQRAALGNRQRVSYLAAAQGTSNVGHTGQIVLPGSAAQQRPGFVGGHDLQASAPPVTAGIHQGDQRPAQALSDGQTAPPGVAPHECRGHGPPGNDTQQQGEEREETHPTPPSYLRVPTRRPNGIPSGRSCQPPAFGQIAVATGGGSIASPLEQAERTHGRTI